MNSKVKKNRMIAACAVIAVTLLLVHVTAYVHTGTCFAAETKPAVCESAEEAGDVLRDAMKARKDSAGICLITDVAASDSEGLMSQIFEEATKHTGNAVEGDYIRFQYDNCQASAKPVSIDGSSAVLFTYVISYYDSSEQEKAVDEKVSEVMSGLGLEGRTDLEKTEIIYDYLRENVKYDYDNLADSENDLKRTAYSALVEGKAVCQGYSAALYRLLLEAGVDNRIIFGASPGIDGEDEDHTWNIVKIGEVYYNTDLTRDSESGTAELFLKGSGPFDEDHMRSDEYLTEEFTSEYVISDTDFSAEGSSKPERAGASVLDFRNIARGLFRKN